jgi:hypothetical protein
MGDIDPAVAEDLGIVTTPERFDEVIASGKQVASLMPQPPQLPLTQPTERDLARAEDHAFFANEFNMRDWSNLPPEQQAINAAGFTAVRAALDELKKDK